MADIASSIILVQLLLAHLVVDFFIQPRSWIDDRRKNAWRSKKLYYHSILAGIVPFILLGSIDNWAIVPAFALTHLAIDGMRSRYADSSKAFVADQALHLAVIVMVWLLAFSPGPIIDQLAAWTGGAWNDPTVCLVLLGAAMLTLPAGIFVGKVMKRWEPEDAEGADDERGRAAKGLQDAGKAIGITERVIVFVLILAGQFTVIGFVIATKSIFRLKEGSTRAEYYLVGSMLSFSIAIATGLIIQYLIGLAA